jgi:hypothetical protein
LLLPLRQFRARPDARGIELVGDEAHHGARRVATGQGTFKVFMDEFNFADLPEEALMRSTVRPEAESGAAGNESF